MIAYVSGICKEIEEDSVVIDVGGIGYRVFTPITESLVRKGVGNPMTLYTHFCVREDAQILYGFLEKSTLKLFRQLINVNGVGPKYALAILTQLSENAVILAIASGDHKALTKVSGIGPKTAQRIVLDLKDKVSVSQEDATLMPEIRIETEEKGSAAEVLEALSSLGYTRAEASAALGKIYDEKKTVQQLVKEALRQLAAF
ncbi:MAG TPA: Holliday junction branch migration protein RuvA [Candidatus Faecimorpha stercoravium]|nr:Holliday junction branch migration protein RuvA [Candidatus Faecimorpha stercoravium]